MWVFGAFVHKKSFVFWWILAVMLHVRSTFALAELYDERVVWVNSLKHHVSHVPYRTDHGHLAMLPVDAINPELASLIGAAFCNGFALCFMVVSVCVEFDKDE